MEKGQLLFWQCLLLAFVSSQCNEIDYKMECSSSDECGEVNNENDQMTPVFPLVTVFKEKPFFQEEQKQFVP